MDYSPWSRKNSKKCEIMKIGNLSQESGVSRDTVRLYEKLGLLKDITRPYEFNNYKNYGDRNVERIKMIKQLQGMGITLRECKEILEAIDNGEFDEKSGKEFIQSRIVDIDSKISELEKTKAILLEKFGQCTEGDIEEIKLKRL